MGNFEEEKLKKIIVEISKQYNFSEEVAITFSRGSAKGSGYMGEIVSIHIVDDETQETLHLIAKISMKEEKVRQTLPVAKCFGREIYVYTKIFPSFQKFQLEAKIERPFDAVAKYYASSTVENEEYLIFEDLRESGFEMYPIKNLLDHEHTTYMFEKYAELHALSLAMKVLQPLEFQKLKNGLTFTLYEIITQGKVGNFFLTTWKSIRDAMEEKECRYEIVDAYAENCLVKIKTMINAKEENFSSILHGDCWMNNFMFNYKVDNGKKKLNKMKMLDWQACHIGSPVFDLSYVLYCAGSKTILDNLDSYLKIYHESLTNMLWHFGLDANSIFPFKELKKQWKKYCHFGAIMAGPVWKVRSLDEKQVVDHLNYSSDGDDIYVDKIVAAECDKNYLVTNIKMLCDHLNAITHEEI